MGIRARIVAVAVVFALGPICGLARGEVIYVRASAEDSFRDGTSWEDAFVDLQDALAVAAAGDSIWVAAGVYVPGDHRGASFELVDGVELLGGLAGDEVPGAFVPDHRDLVANETVLSGDLGTEQTYHVVVADAVGASATLDGFLVTGGNAAGLTATLDDVGGGMLIVDASPTIRRCNFVGNVAGTKGGAVHILRGSPSFVSCRFLDSATTVTQVGRNFGGAVYVEGETFSAALPSLVNCLFRNNRAGVGLGGEGAAIYAAAFARPHVANCTIVENSADGAVGGVFGSAEILNSVLWGNTGGVATGNAAQVGQVLSIAYSSLPEAFPGTGNVEGDPALVSRDMVAGFQHPLDLVPAPGSILIDAGRRSERAEQERFDLGGDFRFVDDPSAADTGEPSSLGPVIDIGAFEHQARCTVDVDCDDGRVCNGVEVCMAGVCTSGDRIDCDDGVSCTADQCDEETAACMHVPIPGECDDGLFCNGAESCDAGTGCVSGSPPTCDDGIGCTIDSCDEASRSCLHDPDHDACDDGAACNGIERCDESVGCIAGEAIDCDDGVACTTDSCDDADGACRHEPDDTACDDALYCNGAESCDSSTGCVAGDPPCGETECDESSASCLTRIGCTSVEECDDGDACTTDLCIDAECVPTANEALCDDGDECTVGDRCSAGVCAGETVPGCGGSDGGGSGDPNGGGGSQGGSSDADPGGSGGGEPDADADGVPDEDDLCAKTNVGDPVDPEGCSCEQRDSDGDGVVDCDDRCEGTPGGAVIDDVGCVAEEDDDVPDGDQPGDGGPSDNEPPADPGAGQNSPGDSDAADSDGDGVADVIDICPDTEPGVDADESGCPAESPGTDVPAGQGFGASPCGACGPAQAAVLWPAMVLLTIVRATRRRSLDR